MAITPDAAVEIFQTDSLIIFRPSGKTSDGHRFAGPVSLKRTWPIHLDELGKAALDVLQQSKALYFTDNRAAIAAKNDERLQDLLGNLGISSLGEVVRLAKYIAIAQYGKELDIEHSEAITTDEPSFRRFSKAKTVHDPSASILGQEIMAAFDRCTLVQKF